MGKKYSILEEVKYVNLYFERISCFDDIFAYLLFLKPSVKFVRKYLVNH